MKHGFYHLMLSAVMAAMVSTAAAADAPNYGLAFNGIDSYVDVTTSPVSNLISNFTLEAWALSTTSTGAHRILSCAGTTATVAPIVLNTGWGFGVRNRQWRITTYAVKDYDTTANSVQLNTWTHVAVTLDAANTATFYIDGQYAMAIPFTKPCNPTTNTVMIGRNPTDFTFEFWEGRLDEVRAWNYVRTQAEIAADMEKTLVGNEPGLVLYCPFQEFTGTTTADKTGNSQVTPVIHNATWTAGAPFPKSAARDWELLE